MARTILHEDDRGYVIAEGNELTVGSKVDDAPKVRVAVPINNGGGGGCVSFNHARSYAVCFGDQQEEMSVIRVEQAEDVRGTTSPKAEINFMVNDGGPDDGNMKKPLAFIWNVITKCTLALFGGTTDTMWAPDGLTFTQQQSDGNFVSYRVDRPFDKGANPVALWSAWTGRL